MTKPTINPHIAQRLEERAKKIRRQHSTFWMGAEDVDDLARKVEVGSLDYIERLRKVQRGVGNLVKIVTSEEIPVIYSSGQQSYTDGKTVVLSADIDPAGLDAMCGTALHEAAHCKLSNEALKFLKVMHPHFADMVSGTKLPTLAAKLGIHLTPEDATKAAKPGTTQGMRNDGETTVQHVQMVMNVLEDRRIDLWMYQNAPGYQSYYDAMYDEYWHSPKIDAALQSPQYREKTVQNYTMFVINLTNQNWDGKALPGLADIRKIANLTEKGLASRSDDDAGWKTYKSAYGNGRPSNLDRFPKLFADAVRIVEIMYENSSAVRNSNQPEPQDGDGEGDMKSDLPNMDSAPSRREVEKAIEGQKKFLNHDTGKKEIDAQSKDTLDQMDKSKASVVDVEGEFLPRGVKARVIVYRDVTKKIVESQTFPFRYSGYRYGYGQRQGNAGRNPMMEDALKDGVRMGQILAHRLRVMSDESPLTFNRQEHGRLDKRRVSALGFGAEDVFQFTTIEKKKPANLWIDVDFSGSMMGEKVKRAMTLAVAVAYASSKTRTLNVTIAIRDGGNDAAHIAILYDSRRHTFNRLREVLPFIDAAGGTPESLCFEAVKDEMMKMFGNERKYFINLSDGEPGHGFSYKGKHYSYGGQDAYKHCRMLMNEFRTAGIEVLSYYIGDSTYEHAGFKSMYGLDARFIDAKAVTQIATTINKLLLK